MNTTSRAATAVAAAVLAGGLVVGLAAPAGAAPVHPDVVRSSTSADVSTPTPGVSGLETAGGRTVLTGTGIPSALVTVDTGLGGGTLTLVDDDGTWSVDVTRASTTRYTVRQNVDGVRSAPVVWSAGDAPVAAGSSVVAPPSGPATPVIVGLTTDGGRVRLTGTGTPGNVLVAKTSVGGGTISRIADDGTWSIDVTHASLPRIEVREGAGGGQSAPAYFSMPR